VTKLGLILLLPGCFFIALGISESYAGESISVRADVNKGFVTIGEHVQCTVLVRHSSAIRLLSSIEFPNTRDFEIKVSRDISPKEEKGVMISGRQFEIAAYGLGEFVIEGIPIQYMSASGEQKEIRTNRLYITVESVDKSGKPKSDIRGIKGPADLPSTIGRWMLVLIFLLLLAASGMILWKRFVHGKPLSPVDNVVLTPHEEAYQALRRLYDSSLIREGRVKEYYIRLSEIIKRYLERRFEFSAVEKTTEEIVSDLRHIELDGAIRSAIRGFLDDTDIVKFAKYLPEPQEIVAINRQSMNIVDKTKIVETPPVVNQNSLV